MQSQKNAITENKINNYKYILIKVYIYICMHAKIKPYSDH